MGRFVAGDVVVIDFPYSDLIQRKRRPALVLAAIAHNDYVLCQITSRSDPSEVCVPIHLDDFTSGSLKKESYARPDFLATVNDQAIMYQVGMLTRPKMDEIVDALMRVLRPEAAESVNVEQEVEAKAGAEEDKSEDDDD